ncbi:MAG: glycine cleavage system aminomethyltransferase GcvT [Acidobacteria bacterium]|nr:glycine cleavage system aminomethyltransferase GcvT [Acidobacteriota bacterium]MCG2811804.1 glycine cleavage system aminomethyltransferase GcvT [Candidatus Aminicenantes bacterium]
MEGALKKTKFNEAHYVLKGKMIEFCGWDLPVQYSGVSAEHVAVRTSGGIFDVSHMGEIFFRGPQALDAVQYLTSNDAAKLIPGKVQYSGLMTEKGCFVDDLLVHKISDTEYFIVVNAANLEKDYAWMKSKTTQFDVEVINESADYAQVAIQGPKAGKLLAELTNTDLAAMSYYTFTKGEVMGMDAIIARTGYTGEYGFEVYIKDDAQKASKLFLELCQKGEKYGIVPVGLGARDSLRLECCMALYGNDIDDSHTILEANLAWILKLQKGDFIGKDVLLKQKEAGIQRKLVGFEMIGRGIARHGYPVYVDGQQFETIGSGTMTPFLKKAVGMTYLPMGKTETGSEFQVKIREELVTAKVVATPFYKFDQKSI